MSSDDHVLALVLINALGVVGIVVWHLQGRGRPIGRLSVQILFFSAMSLVLYLGGIAPDRPDDYALHGFAALLLLAALGVGQDDILANYLESNQRNAQFNAAALAQMGALGVDAAVMMPLLEVRASYLEASMQAIEAGWGSVGNYLHDALQVDVAQLRAHYLAG